jgi:hypothetical protein
MAPRTTGWERLEHELRVEALGIARAIADEMATNAPTTMSLPEIVATGVASAFHLGLDIGIALAVRDLGTAERIRRFMNDVVQERDPRSLDERARMVARLIAAARVA